MSNKRKPSTKPGRMSPRELDALANIHAAQLGIRKGSKGRGKSLFDVVPPHGQYGKEDRKV